MRTVEDRAESKAHGTSEVRPVSLEVGNLEIITVLLRAHFTHLGAERGVGVGTGLEVRAQLACFFVTVNDVERVGVDQHHILETENPDRPGKELVQLGMGLSVG